MKILIVTPHFFPENFKVNDMAFELSKRGHEVTVLTAIPDYPQGKYYDGYGIFKKQREVIDGVNIIRTTIIPRHDGSPKLLVLNYLSYTLFSMLKGISLALTKKFDAVVVHETSPMMVGVPAVIVKKLQRIPLHFWVLDLWPESLKAAGGIKNKSILNCFGNLSRWIYNNCKTILISSKGFSRSISELGDYAEKIKYFPNWNDVKSTGNSSCDVPALPNGFNILFAGNIGDAQDMPNIVECAKLLNGSNVNIILVGDGRRKQYVEDLKEKYSLDNIFLLGRYPIEAMSCFFSKADVLFLSLKDEPIFSLTVPAKLQAYMASGKPIVAMINGEGADLVKEADCGWSVPAGDYEGLAKLLLSISKESCNILNQKGLNGKKFSEEHFDFQKSIDSLEEILNKN